MGKFGFLPFLFFRDNASSDDYIDILDMGLTSAVYERIEQTVFPIITGEIDLIVRDEILNATGSDPHSVNGHYNKSYVVDCEPICFAMGKGTVRAKLAYSAMYSLTTNHENNDSYYLYDWAATGTVEYFDIFKDPLDVLNVIGEDIEVVGGTPYNYGHFWRNVEGIGGSGTIIRKAE